jgi:hypothetical protein
MGLVAVISREPGVTRDEWLSCVRGHRALNRTPSRWIKNPFTGASVEHVPDDAEVQIVVVGIVLGAIEPSPEFDDDKELHVYAPDTVGAELAETVREIANSLGAVVQWAEDLKE